MTKKNSNLYWYAKTVTTEIKKNIAQNRNLERNLNFPDLSFHKNQSMPRMPFEISLLSQIYAQLSHFRSSRLLLLNTSIFFLLSGSYQF